MQLKTLVKVSAINNLSDARYCAGMGVAMMGFSIDNDHAHHLSPEKFKAIVQWIQGVKLIGELNTTDPAVIQQVLDQYAVDCLELSSPVAMHSITNLAIPLIIKLKILGNETLHALQAYMSTYAPYCQYFLLEADASPESDLATLQPTINHLAQQFPILQGYNITAARLPELLTTKLQGIALKGGIETQPGYKDFDALADVLEYLAIT